MKCPYCNREHKSPHHNTAELNCDAYGDRTYNFQCSHCNQVYAVLYQRVVTHQEPHKSSATVSDASFGLG